MPSLTEPDQRRRWLRVPIGILLVGMTLLALLYFFSPALLSGVAVRLAAAQGIELLQFEVRRPGLRQWHITKLAGRREALAWSARNLQLTYQWRALLSGRFQTIQIDELELVLQRSAQDSDATPLTLDRSLLARLPDQLSPSVWLQQLPWQSLRVKQLQLLQVSTQLQAHGALTQQGEQLELMLRMETLQPPLRQEVLVRYGPTDGLQLSLERPDAGTPVLAVSSRFGADTLDLNLRSQWDNTDALLLEALVGSMGMQLAGSLTAHTRLPWPLPVDFALADLRVNGSFSLSVGIPDPPADAQRTVAANGFAASLRGVALRELSGTFDLRDGTAALYLDHGVFSAAQAGTGSEVQCALIEPLVVTLDREQLSFTDGLQCDLKGDAGSLRLDIGQLDYRLVTPAELSLRLAFGARYDRQTLRGALQVTLQEPEQDRIEGSGLLQLQTALLQPAAANQNSVPLPFEFSYQPKLAQGELRVRHSYQLGQRLMTQWQGKAPAGMDLSQARLRYEGTLRWRDDQFQGQMTGAFTDALLENNPNDSVDALRLRPLSGSFTLNLAGAALTLVGEVERTPLRLPYRLKYDLERSEGALSSDFAVNLLPTTAQTLFANWSEPWDLTAGQLQGKLQVALPADGSARVAADLELRGAGLRYEEYGVAGIGGQFQITGGASPWRIVAAALRADSLDVGFPITNLQLGLEYQSTGMQQRLQFTGISARLLGGQAQIPGFAMDLLAPQAEFGVTLTGLSLAEVLALEGEDIDGTGILNGLLPVQLIAGRVHIAQGQLEAQPPGGVIRLSRDFSSLTGQPGLDFAVKALGDFRYDRLTSTVDYEPSGDLVLGVALRGKNPEVEQGRTIQYNLRVSENVLSLLESFKADRLITEQVERRVNQ